MRCTLLVLDSVGIGELPDAALYGDKGSNTLANTAKEVGGLSLPTLQKLGLGNIAEIERIKVVSYPEGAIGKCREVSAGKNTMTGHWEMMGIKLESAFPTYPKGFPEEIIKLFEKEIGRKVLGNKPASGTQIIEELGEEHLRTGYPIVYTSADSVFQIAAHRDVIDLEELYSMCRIARYLLKGKHNVARVIARPFVGKLGSFKRIAERKDFTLSPPHNVLDELAASNVKAISIGKIAEMFAGRGFTKEVHGVGNDELVSLTIEELEKLKNGLVFTNLGDFDTLWGHRNNAKGYANALEKLDTQLINLLDLLKENDLLIITADHGCDPTIPSTDHSREYVPLLVTGKKVKKGFDLGIRDTFGDIGQTIAEYFGVSQIGVGKSFLKEVT